MAEVAPVLFGVIAFVGGVLGQCAGTHAAPFEDIENG
jgi:hypothetical protein